MQTDSLYIYKASVIRVIDGDTCVLQIDLGFHVFVEETCRLAHINTPELNSVSAEIREKAIKAKEKLVELLTNPEVTIKSSKPFKGDKFGRFLVEIINSSGVNVNQELINSGLAMSYSGGKKI